MRKSSAILMLFVLLLSTVVVAVSCESAESNITPTGTVNTLLNALEDLNATKMMECMEVSVSNAEVEGAEEAFQMMKEM